MAKNIYVGVGGKARHVKALYVGVGGKARKVKKVYVGVGGKARLVYQSYIPVTGISLSVSYKTSTVPYTNRKYNYCAVIDATPTPTNATNQALTWSMTQTKYIGNMASPYVILTLNTSNNGKHLEITGYYKGFSKNYGLGSATYTLAGKSVDGATVTRTVTVTSYQYTDSDGDSDEVLGFTVA